MSVIIFPDPINTLSEVAQVLQQQMRGQVILSSHPEYDEVGHIWNEMNNHHPAIIVRCLGTSDVIEAVNFARDYNLEISVRGGEYAVTDNSVMIDVSLMCGIRVNPQKRSVQMEIGAIWSDVVRETQLFGLAVPNRHISTTGIAGLSLADGYGHLRNKYGLTADNLLSVDIVTAEGRLLTANKQENTDFFWAVRRGAGIFGIVTALEFRCHPIVMRRSIRLNKQSK